MTHGWTFIIVYLFEFGFLFFLNSTHKHYHLRALDATFYKHVIINYSIVALLIYTALSARLFSPSLTFNIGNVALFFLLSDFFNYWVHRILHRVPWLKEKVHKTHHVKHRVDLVPLDFLHLRPAEFIAYVVFGQWILAIFTLNFVEYFVCDIVLIAHQYYVHGAYDSDFILPFFNTSKYHERHHFVGGGNYSMFFPLWDLLLGTTIRDDDPQNNSSNLLNNYTTNKHKQECQTPSQYTTM